jgi:NADPH-dependent 7-cyano-7-deazaguanine reductase QueF
MDGSNIDFAEVWASSFDDESSINPDILKKIASYGNHSGFSNQMFELAAFCPFSILSDTGTIWIDYSPQNKPIEFKSKKNFFNFFCNIEIFQEYIKSWIRNVLNPLLVPE